MNTVKKTLTLPVIVGAIISMALLTGCQTATTNQTATGASQKEALLVQSGFKVKTVTTQKQQQHVSQLAVGRVSAREVQRQSVLRLSHGEEGPDLCRHPGAVQRV